MAQSRRAERPSSGARNWLPSVDPAACTQVGQPGWAASGGISAAVRGMSKPQGTANVRVWLELEVTGVPSRLAEHHRAAREFRHPVLGVHHGSIHRCRRVGWTARGPRRRQSGGQPFRALRAPERRGDGRDVVEDVHRRSDTIVRTPRSTPDRLAWVWVTSEFIEQPAVHAGRQRLRKRATWSSTARTTSDDEHTGKLSTDGG